MQQKASLEFPKRGTACNCRKFSANTPMPSLQCFLNFSLCGKMNLSSKAGELRYLYIDLIDIYLIQKVRFTQLSEVIIVNN